MTMIIDNHNMYAAFIHSFIYLFIHSFIYSFITNALVARRKGGKIVAVEGIGDAILAATMSLSCVNEMCLNWLNTRAMRLFPTD